MKELTNGEMFSGKGMLSCRIMTPNGPLLFVTTHVSALLPVVLGGWSNKTEIAKDSASVIATETFLFRLCYSIVLVVYTVLMVGIFAVYTPYLKLSI